MDMLTLLEKIATSAEPAKLLSKPLPAEIKQAFASNNSLFFQNKLALTERFSSSNVVFSNFTNIFQI